MTQTTKRLRDYGLTVGQMEPGANNHISDVPGVSVGHVTLNHDTNEALEPGVCTGVTAILPHADNWFTNKCVAAAEVINGFGKTTGLVQLQELCELESPILLTNTLSVPAATQGALRYILDENPTIGDTRGSVNMVVGECNDSYLNDMRGMHVTPNHAVEVIELAKERPSLAEGAVGGGTGMRCFGWKGGIGSASRKLRIGNDTYHIGVLVQSNFGNASDLTILGAPVGRHFTPKETGDWQYHHENRSLDGSIMMVLATDLPLDAHQLQRLAKRCVVGLARTGSYVHHGSGDVVIAFSNGNHIRHIEDADRQVIPVTYLSGALVSDAFRAIAESTEEAVLNSLFAAKTTRGRENRVLPALPRDEVADFVMRWNRTL